MTKSGCNVFLSFSSKSLAARFQWLYSMLTTTTTNKQKTTKTTTKKTTKTTREATYVKLSTLRLIRSTVVLEKQSRLNFESVSVFLSWLPGMQTACAILYCHLWPLWLCHIFPHYHVKDMIFGEKLLNIKCFFFISFTTFVWHVSHLRRIQRHSDHKCSQIFM